MFINALQDFAAESPAAASLAGVLLLASLLYYFVQRPQRLNFPIVELGDDVGYDRALGEGFSKYPDSPFVLPTTPPIVILPHACVNEVKSLPENKVSFTKDAQHVFTYKVTGIGEESHEILSAIKIDLTRNLNNVLDGLQDEARYAINSEFGPCEDWTPQPVYSKLTRIVALLSGRIFVGRPLSRDEAWVKATINYTWACVQASYACKRYSPYLRNFVGPYLKEVKNLKKLRQEGADLLQPIMNHLLQKTESEKLSLDGFDDEPGTFCSWILKYTNEKERASALHLANSQMAISFAAIHTTSMANSEALFDLAAHPEYIKILREEIKEVLTEDGYDIDGEGFTKLKKSSFNKLRKLDSFIKESQRFSPPGIISLQRMTTSNVTLSTGHTIPTNTRIAFASQAIHRSPLTTTFSPEYNPASYAPPSVFDGLRFYKLREMPGKENRHQYVTTERDSLSFGYGIHACPGRFFASSEIKVVIIELLRNWDLRLKGDTERKGGDKPPSSIKETACMPNMEAELEFRRLGREERL
ncbi:hypothetical protein VE03_09880 [Pseudogymnoascus sp. 23342-1-I1]|nr:hypothetical protein VE03_09880 [Pseudogymnoascus sp. 23342-1-I1]